MQPEKLIETASSVADKGVAAQVWVLIIFMMLVGVWYCNLLRKELNEQSRKREVLITELTKVVADNTRAIDANTGVLDQTKYQLKRSQETLDKFTT